MLGVLRQIVQEVNEAQDLQEVLQIIVDRLSKALGVEACSAYLAEHTSQQYRLVASLGFLEGVNGSVTIPFSEGLVGLVGDREEPINLSEAMNHPSYRYYPETGEERYQAFLGVPIIHQRKVLGVLVIQQRQPRRFDEGEVAFLVTLSVQLAGSIAYAQHTIPSESAKVSLQHSSATLHGIAAAPGIAIGTAVVISTTDLDAVVDREIEDTLTEIHRFEEALKVTREDIKRLKTRLEKTLLPEEQNLFDAYLSILNSKSIKQDIIDLIQAGHWAPWALRKIIKRQISKFDAMEDPYLKERAWDILDLGRRILTNLQSESIPIQNYPTDTILIGDDISASFLAEVSQNHLLGVVSVKGSANSHVAILARAMGIPAVMGVAGLQLHRLEAKQVIIDGYHGEVLTSPTPAMILNFGRLAKEEKELYAGLSVLRDYPAMTTDGVQMSLCVNAGLVADIRPALSAGAEGVGLYRTEVAFMIRDRFPSEEEQYLIYRQLLESFYPKPVTLRTLDVGGDKLLPYFPIEENNPFLGWRGIRITLDHPEIFLVQLRAMLRASAGLKNLKILFPMVSTVSEVDEALRLLRQAHCEVVDEGAQAPFPQTGVMIEVPSAVFQAHEIVKRVDFLSVGSNDLIQYLLAVDRNNAQVADLYNHFHPAVLRALKIIVDAAHYEKKTATLCGEMASDPLAVIVLLGLGYDVLSMNAHSIPRVKWVVRELSKAQATALTCEVLQMSHSEDIYSFLQNALDNLGLDSPLRLVR